MTRRWLPILLVGAIVGSLAIADDKDAGGKADEGSPLRLKRKKRDGEAPLPDKLPPPKDDKAKEPANEKEKEKEDGKIQPEDGVPPPEQEDEKEVLERIQRNMRAVEEKLGSRELGEPTAQQQRDILKDIDSLIKKNEQGGGGGGGGGQPPPQGGEQDQQQQQQQGGGGGGGQQKRPSKGGMGGQQKQSAHGGRQQKQRRELRSERGQGKQKNDRAMAQNQPGGNQPQPQPQPKDGKGGEQPGKGKNDGPQNPRESDLAAEKGVWGHLPESLRAEMNAYSNPQPFLPRYDRLIREYYKTIAEQGRKKGD